MKKIFIPLLALCGMVAGLTLTSCGGGGGDKGYVGRAFEFECTFGTMLVTFESQYTVPENSNYQAYDATVCFKEEGSNYTLPGACTVSCTYDYEDAENDLKGMRIDVSAIGPEALTENAVLAFMGRPLQDADGEGTLENCAFYMVVEELPLPPVQYITGGKIVVEQLAADENAEEEVDEAVDEVKNTKVSPLKGIRRQN